MNIITKDYFNKFFDNTLEAEQAYNIAMVILNSFGNNFELNDTPVPSLEVYKRTILLLRGTGWRASQQDIKGIKDRLTQSLGMVFPE